MKQVTLGLGMLAMSCSMAHASGLNNVKDSTVKPTKRWVVLLSQGERLSRKGSSMQRIKGANMLLRSHRMAPTHFKTLVAATRACMLRGFETNKSSKMRYWGERGWRLAKQIIRRWPNRSQGYAWAAIHIGLIAKGSSHASVFFRGLHIAVEKNAKAALKRKNVVYSGVGHRILGRFYYRLPWPMRKLDKSLKHLRTSYILAPKDANGLFFYAETLVAKGKKKLARKIYQECAEQSLNHKLSNFVQVPGRTSILACREWLKKN